MTTETTPDTIYATPANWVATGTGAQGNLFLTGRAGTGKTTMLRKFLAGAGEKAIVLAPTGVAAMNAGGQTIHSFFKFPPRLIEPTDIKRLRSTRLVKAIDTMIIDEISMVRSDMLDAIDKSLKLNRASKRPFGGVRMILSGDLHQLPPVVSGQEAPILPSKMPNSPCWPSNMCFGRPNLASSPCWARCAPDGSRQMTRPCCADWSARDLLSKPLKPMLS